jgi:hypothetical protein
MGLGKSLNSTGVKFKCGLLSCFMLSQLILERQTLFDADVEERDRTLCNGIKTQNAAQ